jgi:hypothetical protein
MATEASIVISAQDKFSAVFGQATSGLGKLQQSASQLSTVLGGIAAGGFVASVTSMVRSAIQLADELGDLSQRTGIAVESLSAFQQSAEVNGVATEEFASGIRRLNLALVDAQDSGSKAAQIFRALGVDVTQGTEVALRGVVDAFAQLPDGATKAALANELLGRAGERLIPLLNEGAAGLDRARAAAERFGTLISAQVSADAQRFNDNLTKLKQSTDVLAVSIGNALVPAFATISDNLVVARSRGDTFIQTLREIDKLVISAFGGVENLFTGGGGFFDRRAAAQFQFYANRESPGNTASGTIGRPGMGPDLPAGRAPDPAALLRALAPPRAAGAGAGSRGAGGLSFDDLMAQAAARRTALQDANESTFNADADRQQQALLDFYADLAMAQQLRIELAEQEGERAADSLQREAEAIKDRLDPTREYIRALERVAELQERGLLNDREAIAETNRLAEALKNNGQVAQESERVARDIGLTFTSAFEAAIGGSKSFRDILKGLESDLLKLGTRKLITEPLFDGIQGLLGGMMGGGGGGAYSGIGSFLAGLIPSFAVGTDYVPRTGLAMIHKGERIIPAAENRAGMGGGPSIVFNISTPDANSFRSSSGQIAAKMAMAIASGQRNM